MSITNSEANKEMENMLYQAAATDNVRALGELLQDDPFLLDRVSYTCSNKTPLHVATIKGHLAIVRAILRWNPQLAEDLDSQQSSALHMAAARGYVKIVRKLLSAAPDMLLSRDCQGMNPLHVAAAKGHVLVLEEMIRRDDAAAREKLDGGLTVLHLCVKYCKLDSLIFLVNEYQELIYVEDDDGDTILHMVVRTRLSQGSPNLQFKLQVILHLVGNRMMDVNASNSKGLTPMDILQQTPSHGLKRLVINHLRGISIEDTTTTHTPQVTGISFKRRLFMWILMAACFFFFIMMISYAYWSPISVLRQSKQDLKSLANTVLGEEFTWSLVMSILLGNVAVVSIIGKWSFWKTGIDLCLQVCSDGTMKMIAKMSKAKNAVEST